MTIARSAYTLGNALLNSFEVPHTYTWHVWCWTY